MNDVCRGKVLGSYFDTEYDSVVSTCDSCCDVLFNLMPVNISACECCHVSAPHFNFMSCKCTIVLQKKNCMHISCLSTETRVLKKSHHWSRRWSRGHAPSVQ